MSPTTIDVAQSNGQPEEELAFLRRAAERAAGVCPTRGRETSSVCGGIRPVWARSTRSEPTRARLMEFVDRCPVHQTLMHEIKVSRLAS